MPRTRTRRSGRDAPAPSRAGCGSPDRFDGSASSAGPDWAVLQYLGRRGSGRSARDRNGCEMEQVGARRERVHEDPAARVPARTARRRVRKRSKWPAGMRKRTRRGPSACERSVVADARRVVLQQVPEEVECAGFLHREVNVPSRSPSILRPAARRLSTKRRTYPGNTPPARVQPHVRSRVRISHRHRHRTGDARGFEARPAPVSVPSRVRQTSMSLRTRPPSPCTP